MGTIGKRFLNVLTLLCTAYLLVLLFTILTVGVSNWYVFIGTNIGALVVGYSAIVGVNYIVFGKLTLWHKNVRTS